MFLLHADILQSFLALILQDCSPIKRSFCFTSCFGATVKNVRTQMIQGTVLSNTKHDAGIAVTDSS